MQLLFPILIISILSILASAEPSTQRAQPGAFGPFNAFSGGGGGVAGGIGRGGYGNNGKNQTGKAAAKSIETFGTKTVEGINKAQENFSKSVAEGSKNALDFSKLTPDLNSQVSDGLKSVSDGIAKINEQFKSDENRKSIGEDTVDQNIEAIKNNTKTQMEINAIITGRYTDSNTRASTSIPISNLNRVTNFANNINANPVVDTNHNEPLGFTRGVAYKSPFKGSKSK